MKKCFLCLAYLVVITFGLYAQPAPDFKIIPLNEFVPPSPTAASLGKYVDQPVNLYTGIPEIDIPIYTIDAGGFQLPISISYHAGGIKVKEGAGWVGLGWSLNANGVINRTVRSLEDLSASSSNSYIKFRNRSGGVVLDPDNAQDYQTLSAISNGQIDCAPDLYQFNMPGYSGKFMLVDHVMMIPEQPVKVSPYGTGYPMAPGSFVLRDPKGNAYYFDEKESAHTKSGSATNRVTSYLLTKILTPLKEYINFFYGKSSLFTQDMSTTFYQEFGTTLGGGSFPPVGQVMSTTSQTVVSGKVLTQIDWKGGSVIFYSSNDRLDFAPQSGETGDYKLDALVVVTSDGQIIKRVEFNYGYFNGPDGAKRLKLESIVFKGLNGAQDETHKFIYEENVNLPSRSSMEFDHWGYFNGNGITLPTLNADATLDLSSKNPELSNARANTLLEIIHPSKGKTIFEYELNQYYSAANSTTTKNFSCSADPLKTGDFECQTSFYVSEHVEKLEFNTTIFQNNGDYYENYVKIVYPDDGTGELPRMVLRKADNGKHIMDVGSLPPGWYEVICHVDANKNAADITGMIVNRFYENDVKAGGLRVKRIRKNAGDGTPDIVKTYQYTNDNGHSSGSLLQSKPVYMRGKPEYIPRGSKGDLDWCGRYEVNQHLIIYSGLDVVNFSSSPVGYEKVTVLEGTDGANGKTIYTFRTGGENTNDQSWMYGQKLSETYVDNTGTIIQAEQNFYSVRSSPVLPEYSLSVEQLGGHYCSQDYTYNPSYPRTYSQTLNTYTQGWISLDNTIRKTLDRKTGQYITTTTRYSYDQYQQPVLINNDFGTNEKKIITSFTYPQNKGGMAVYDVMIDNNQVGEVIEKSEIVQYGEDIQSQKLIGGQKLKYELLTIGSKTFCLPRYQYSLHTNTPLKVNTSVPEDNCGATVPCFKKITTFDYKDKTRPASVTDHNSGIISSYIWSSRDRVLASVMNAGSNQIAYTSFEWENSAQEFGGWTINSGTNKDESKTGIASLQSANVSKSGLPSGDYWVTLFAKGSGTVHINGNTINVNDQSNWKYESIKLSQVSSVTVAASANVMIDELRLYPVNAAMRTFSYLPLIGLTSITNENGITEHYRYDGQGRLSVITDDKGNILKDFRYNLKK